MKKLGVLVLLVVLFSWSYADWPQVRFAGVLLMVAFLAAPIVVWQWLSDRRIPLIRRFMAEAAVLAVYVPGLFVIIRVLEHLRS